MNVWMLNNYCMPPDLGHLNRHYFFGKYLKSSGHKPVVFAGSKLHNTNLQMIDDGSLYKVCETCGYPFVFVRTCDYGESRIKRIWSMFEYYHRLLKAADDFDKPDVIIGSSPHPLAALAAIELSRRYNSQCIVEVRDLWPESFAAYGLLNSHSPLLKPLYAGEKWLYERADKVIFTMEGGPEYISEKGWGRDIPLSKIGHINNGVDPEEFTYNRDHFVVEGSDLNDGAFKVVYAGSIRRVNRLDRLVDVARILREVGSEVRMLIYGDGDQKQTLVDRCRVEHIDNILFKGRVDKKYIPYILSKATLNIVHWEDTGVMRFGFSANKVFDYLASGKPILSDLKTKYDLVERYQAGISLE